MTEDSDLDETGDDDRPARVRRGLASGGARIDQRYGGPPGGWLWNVVGSLIVLALAFVANNLYQVNLTLAANAEREQERTRQYIELRAQVERNAALDERQDDHINSMDRRLVVVEQVTGVQLRGGPRRGQ